MEYFQSTRGFASLSRRPPVKLMETMRELNSLNYIITSNVSSN